MKLSHQNKGFESVKKQCYALFIVNKYQPYALHQASILLINSVYAVSSFSLLISA